MLSGDRWTGLLTCPPTAFFDPLCSAQNNTSPPPDTYLLLNSGLHGTRACGGRKSKELYRSRCSVKNVAKRMWPSLAKMPIYLTAVCSPKMPPSPPCLTPRLERGFEQEPETPGLRHKITSQLRSQTQEGLCHPSSEGARLAFIRLALLTGGPLCLVQECPVSPYKVSLPGPGI